MHPDAWGVPTVNHGLCPPSPYQINLALITRRGKQSLTHFPPTCHCTFRLFTIYKKNSGNFGWELSVGKNLTDYVIYHLPKISKATKLKKLVKGNRISIWNVPVGKTGLAFQNFRLSREFSSGTKQKIVYHLHPNRNFWEFVVNGKQP